MEQLVRRSSNGEFVERMGILFPELGTPNGRWRGIFAPAWCGPLGPLRTVCYTKSWTATTTGWCQQRQNNRNTPSRIDQLPIDSHSAERAVRRSSPHNSGNKQHEANSRVSAFATNHPRTSSRPPGRCVRRKNRRAAGWLLISWPNVK